MVTHCYLSQAFVSSFEFFSWPKSLGIQVERLPERHETLMASSPSVKLALGGRGSSPASKEDKGSEVDA